MLRDAARSQGVAAAERIRQDMGALPLELVAVAERQVWAAAALKSRYAIAYADAFAPVLAAEREATLVTGDPELRALEEPEKLSILWLERG